MHKTIQGVVAVPSTVYEELIEGAETVEGVKPERRSLPVATAAYRLLIAELTSGTGPES